MSEVVVEVKVSGVTVYRHVACLEDMRRERLPMVFAEYLTKRLEVKK